MHDLFYPACKKMLIDIVYHAVTDWRVLEEEELGWADDDHRAMCNRLGFDSGKEELESFFNSPWFVKMCEEFDDLSDKKILTGLGLKENNT